MANYEVDPSCLENYRPSGTRIDSFEGKTFVSLVAFMFDKTRIVGLPVPGHTKFEEVNLRFYVTPESDPSVRAVTFIREVVPRKAIAMVANRLFGERYDTQPMSHVMGEENFCYRWGRGLENRFSASVSTSCELPPADSLEEFITEHYVGFSRGRGRTMQYRVEHPQWACSAVDDFDIAVRFGENYGSEFAFLDHCEPYNVIFTPGSQVTASFPSHHRMRSAN